MSRYKAELAHRAAFFDTPNYIDPATAQQFLAAGYMGTARYIHRKEHVNDKPKADIGGWLYTLSRQELAAHMSAGLRVMPTQISFSLGKGRLTYENGFRHGSAMRKNCEALEIPKGVTLWGQAEWSDCPPKFGLARSKYRAAAIRYHRGWGDGVLTGGRFERCGVYISSSALTPRQWWKLPQYRSYWKGSSWVVAVYRRGWQAVQGLERSRPRDNAVYGCDIDQNVACIDNLGDRFYWCAPKAA